MKIICSYCRAELGEKPPLDDPRITHSMCESCADHFYKQWKGQSLGEYLDSFDFPVFVVDEDGRLVAANQHLARILGKSDRELVGLLGGEAFECKYARLPEGCGRTVHCRTCTVRRCVQQTHETGEPQHRVPAHLDRGDGTLSVLISTERRGRLVRVTVEPIDSPIDP